MAIFNSYVSYYQRVTGWTVALRTARPEDEVLENLEDFSEHLGTLAAIYGKAGINGEFFCHESMAILGTD